MPIVQFAPFSSLVQPSFWHELTNLKIDILRLSDDAIPIHGVYTTGRSVKDRETGSEIALGCNLSVGSESFDKNFKPPLGSIVAHGLLKNYNTIEDFKAADKTALFNQEADRIWAHALQTRDTSQLNHFLLITFADLKKYKYFYWFAFPAFVAKPAWEISGDGWRNAADVFTNESLSSIQSQLEIKNAAGPLAFFLVKEDSEGTTIASVEDYPSFFRSVHGSSRTIAFIDPSAQPNNPGWPLRNILAYLRVLYPDSTSTVRILCWRDSETRPLVWKSKFGVLRLGADVTAGCTSDQRPVAVGWEKNPQAKLGPRVADLAPMMDPERLANQAVDLNLKLMRWRILPSLDLEKVSKTKCLLLGAGTLGCYVARTLMGWGVRTVTFVDSAHVSFSNPVRQPLFEFEDCLDGGKPKAACAADRMRRIFPGMNASGHMLSIPMPGHPIPLTDTALAQTKEAVIMLEKLIDEHDAVFLLMDSRESRWLPTVIGACKGKIIINAALGFDTFLVMRHGARTQLSVNNNQRLGCYYCNDIVAPSDSLSDRSLDQMCTVTRPGLASIAASTAVELLVSLLQHPHGIQAKASPLQQSISNFDDPVNSSILGLVPHQIRGFLAQFRNMHIVGSAYDRCTGCSEMVLHAYETQGFEMLLKAFNDGSYLPSLTGLNELYSESEAILETVDWNDED